VEDQSLPVLNERTYVKETALALWDNLPWVILAGLLFTAVCLPALVIAVFGFLTPAILVGVLTMGPGWAAMTALITKSVLREQDLSFLVFFRAFRHFYLRGILLACLLATPILSASWTLPAFPQPPLPTVIWISLAANVAFLFFLSLVYQYTYPQIVIYDVGIRVALRNSLVLAIRYLRNSLGLLAMAVIFVILAARISLILLAILPAIWMVFVINNFRMVLQLELN
jgi:uncharacterized membrane protein YesL